MIVRLWLRGPVEMVISPAVLIVWHTRLGPGPWRRALHRVLLAARARYWFGEWALATRHPSAMFDLRWKARLTVTVVEGTTHVGT